MTPHVLGTLAYDRVLLFNGYFKDHILPEKVHELSVSFQVDSITQSFGGTAGNIGYNAALLGDCPKLFALWGDDREMYENYLKEIRLDTTYIVYVPGAHTAQCTVITDNSDSQITGFYNGADGTLYSEPIPTDTDLALLAPAYPGNMRHFAEHYRTHGIRYIFDPGQQTSTFPLDDFLACIEGAWMFISNDYELALTLKKTGWTEDELREKVPMIITTLGNDGSVVHANGEKHIIGIAWADEVAEPTGAGDAYRAGLLAGMARGFSIDASARLGATVASYAIEKKGTQNHTFTLEGLLERHKKAFGETLAL